MTEEITMSIKGIHLRQPCHFVIELYSRDYVYEIPIINIFSFINLLLIRHFTVVRYENIIGNLITVVFIDNVPKKFKSVITEEYIDI